jgi:hypothetical protein
MDATYNSEYGWQITPPPAWHCPPPEIAKTGQIAYGERKVKDVEFTTGDGDQQLRFSWGIVPRPTSDLINARLYYILWTKESKLKEQVTDICRDLVKVMGEITDLNIITFSDGFKAIERTDEWNDSAGQKQKAYIVLFPVRPPSVKQMATFPADQLYKEFVDPITGETKDLYPEHYNLKPGNRPLAQGYVRAGSGQVQMLFFSAPAEKFDKNIDAVRKSAHSFHYTISQAPVAPDVTP